MMRLASLMLALFAVLAIAGCGETSVFEVEDGREAGSAEWSYTIPAGAGLALDAGTPLEVLPSELDARVGESIQIVNEDDRGHLVGPWFVGAGETLDQTFVSPGEFIGECTVHPSGLIQITISA